MIIYGIVIGLLMNMLVYNVVWNCDNDGLVYGYEHLWKYLLVIIDHEHDIRNLNIESLWKKVCVWHNSKNLVGKFYGDIPLV